MTKHNCYQQLLDNIIEELDKKREVAINKKKKDLLKDEIVKVFSAFVWATASDDHHRKCEQVEHAMKLISSK